MSGEHTLPAVIAGLAIGIAFIIVLSVFATPSLTGSKVGGLPIVPEELGQTIEIDFGVSLPERDLIVKKGETIRVPVTIETQGSIEKVVHLSVTPGSMDTKIPDTSELSLTLDSDTLVLSGENIAQGKAWMGDNITIGYGWVVTDAGHLTITASTTATKGTYEYIVEANRPGEPGGSGMGAGKLITVTVTD